MWWSICVSRRTCISADSPNVRPRVTLSSGTWHILFYSSFSHFFLLTYVSCPFLFSPWSVTFANLHRSSNQRSFLEAHMRRVFAYEETLWFFLLTLSQFGAISGDQPDQLRSTNYIRCWKKEKKKFHSITASTGPMCHQNKGRFLSYMTTQKQL